MWIINQKQQIININLFKMVSIENGALIARNGREYQVIFIGKQDVCEELFYKIIDGLTINIPLLEIKN